VNCSVVVPVLDLMYFLDPCCFSPPPDVKSEPPPMGWLRSVGSIQLQVSFAEYRLFYGALLQKRPLILSILLIEATPYCIATRTPDQLIGLHDICIYVQV